MKKLFGFLPALFFPALTSAEAETPFVWPEGKKMAVALSYDDTLNSHLDIVLPQLNAFDLKATFYISGARGELSERMDEWREAASLGHELGNHTLYHPCRKSLPYRDWVLPHQDLDTYTEAQYLEELKSTNTLLQAIDGKIERSFAYTCGETKAGGKSIVEAIQSLVSGARLASASGLNSPGSMDFYKIQARDGGGLTAGQLIDEVKRGKKGQNFVAMYFHGVGGDYLVTDAKAHNEFLQYLAENRAEIWVAPVHDVVTYIKKKRAELSK